LATILNIAANMDIDLELITLVAADGTVEIDREIAISGSALIANMVNLDQDTEIVRLPGFSMEILARAVEYMKFHAGNPAAKIVAPVADDINDAVCSEDADIVKLPPAGIIQLTNAALYLGIGDLMTLCSAKIATMIRGKSDEDICKLFNVTGGYTAEERDAICADTAWAE
jgi:hypothetical protein